MKIHTPQSQTLNIDIKLEPPTQVEAQVGPDGRFTTDSVANMLFSAQARQRYLAGVYSDFRARLSAAIPVFGQLLDELEQLPETISKLESEIKLRAKQAGSSLSYRRLGFDVKFSNPTKKTMNLQKFLASYPNARKDWPQVFEVVETINLETLEMLIAANQIPEVVRTLIEATPTTKEGRVELKYLD